MLVSFGMIAEVGIVTWTMLWQQNDVIHRYVERLPSLGHSTTALLFAALLVNPIACGMALARYRLTQAWRSLTAIVFGGFTVLLLLAGLMAVGQGVTWLVSTVLIATIPMAVTTGVLAQAKSTMAGAPG